MNNDSSIAGMDDNTPLLTVGDYKDMLSKTRLLEAEVRKLQAEITVNKARLAQMVAFAPALESVRIKEPSITRLPGMPPEPNTSSNFSEPVTWTGEILKVVNELKVTDLATLKSRIRSGPLKERIKKTDGGFYSGIKRLVNRGDIIRKDDTLFSIAGHNQGLEPPKASVGTLTVPEVVMQVLDGKPHGLRGFQVHNKLGQLGFDTAENYVYSVLGRLKKKGDIIQNQQTKAYRLKKYRNAQFENAELL